MKYLFFLIFLTLTLDAQKFSELAATQESYLNFSQPKEDARQIYNDESSLLAWQNLAVLETFEDQSKAKAYCKKVTLGNLQWHLPTSYQLKSLNLYSQIAFGHKKKYFASDSPVWDNRLHYAYDAKSHKIFTLENRSETLYVRCVSYLEE